MPHRNLFHVFISRLNALSVRYAITGAAAGTIYGEPRLTHDIDIILDLKKTDVDNFVKAFPLSEFYCPPMEVLRVEMSRPGRGHFNLIHHQTGFKADIYLAGQDELHAWALKNYQALDIQGEQYLLAPVEYVILRKLEYFREGGSEKHLKDIKGMLEISGDRIDFDFLKEKIASMKLKTEWKKFITD
jgi:hypothetical protein